MTQPPAAEAELPDSEICNVQSHPDFLDMSQKGMYNIYNQSYKIISK